MKSKPWLFAAAVVTGAFVAGTVAAPSAQACGGLFCSSAQPVNQAAERIIFSFDQANKQVTAVVEILYNGPAEKFAWLLPVPGVPSVGVSTSAVLDRLQAATNPLYNIQRSWPDAVCRGNANGGIPGAAPTAPPSTGAGKEADSGVTVLASGSVGPYVYDVIMVNPDPAVTDKAMVALDWLMKGGYDVGSIGRQVLQPYLRDGFNLIAFKLNKNQSAGSIRPIMLTYNSDHPMIPIVPTAVAANPDMGILTFVLGARRAVPTNYKSLELNEALIDWFNPNMTYNAVVTAAANEAKGQGFVTEFAEPTSTRNLAQALYQEQSAVAEHRRTADTLPTVDLLVSVIGRFATFTQTAFMGPFAARPGAGMRVPLDGVMDVLSTHLKLPSGVTVAQVMARPRCYLTPAVAGAVYCEGQIAPKDSERIDLTTFDRTAFLLAIEELVIKPIEITAKLFADQPYLTRLYTTLSPAEMTLDPTFDLSTGLPDVSNVHTLALAYGSDAGCFNTAGSWTATIGGLTIRGTGTTWPHDLRAAKMPFNRRILQMTADRPPMVEADNTTVIAQALGGAQPGLQPGLQPGAQPGAQVPAPTNDDGGCAMATGARGPSGAAAFLLALMVALTKRATRRRDHRLP